MKKWLSLLYIPFFPLFPMLWLFEHNIKNGVLLTDALLPLILSEVFGIAVFLLVWFLIRDCIKAGLTMYVVILFFFSYGHLFEIYYPGIKGFVRSFHYPPHHVLETFWVLCIFLVSFFIWRLKKDTAAGISNFVNLTSMILLFLTIFQMTAYYFLRPALVMDRFDHIEKTSGADLSRFPDIYYILPDEYAGHKQMKDIYNYDTTPFEEWLKGQGFYIPQETLGHTPSTIVSLSAVLNMKQPSSHLDLFRSIHQSRVVQYLKFKGYRIVNAGSQQYYTSISEKPDFNIGYYPLWSSFIMWAIKSTMLRPLLSDKFFAFYSFRQIIFHQVRGLKAVPSQPGPKFVFAHLEIPHAPFVFTADGKGPKKRSHISDWKDRSKYLGQYIYTTNTLKNIVTRILKKSERPVIIIIEADHGARRHQGMENINPDDILKLFCAIHVPSKDTSFFPPTFKQEDTFRILFKRYFPEDHFPE